MKRYLPISTVVFAGALFFALVAGHWSAYGQLGAQVAIVIPAIYVLYRSGFMDPPQKRH